MQRLHMGCSQKQWTVAPHFQQMGCISCIQFTMMWQLTLHVMCHLMSLYIQWANFLWRNESRKFLPYDNFTWGIFASCCMFNYNTPQHPPLSLTCSRKWTADLKDQLAAMSSSKRQVSLWDDKWVGFKTANCPPKECFRVSLLSNLSSQSFPYQMIW